MYSEQDLQEVQHQLKRISIRVGIIFLLFLVGSIILANSINNKLGMVVLILGVCLNVFIWGMYGTPVLAYYRFLKDILTGRLRMETGLVKRVDSKPVYKDNKLFYYEIWIDEDGTERMLLSDANKPFPNIQEGKKYQFQVFQNFITDIINE